MTQIYYDSKHPCHKDVVEFFASIVHHCGESMYNNVHGVISFGNKVPQTKFA